MVPFSNFGMFKKVSFEPPFRPSRRQKTSPPNDSASPCRDPAFHETNVITVPLGPTGFWKVVSGLKIDPFSFFSVFLWSVFYTTFLSPFFHDTTVNVKPLSPPIFEKIAHIWNKSICFLFWFFAFAFLLLFHIFVDFREPLAPTPRPKWDFLMVWSSLLPFGVDLCKLFLPKTVKP